MESLSHQEGRLSSPVKQTTTELHTSKLLNTPSSPAAWDAGLKDPPSQWGKASSSCSLLTGLGLKRGFSSVQRSHVACSEALAWKDCQFLATIQAVPALRAATDHAGQRASVRPVEQEAIHSQLTAAPRRTLSHLISPLASWKFPRSYRLEAKHFFEIGGRFSQEIFFSKHSIKG